MKWAKRRERALPPHNFSDEQSRLWAQFLFEIHPRFRGRSHRGPLGRLVKLTERLNAETLSLADADELDQLRRRFELPGIRYQACLNGDGIPTVNFTV